MQMNDVNDSCAKGGRIKIEREFVRCECCFVDVENVANKKFYKRLALQSIDHSGSKNNENFSQVPRIQYFFPHESLEIFHILQHNNINHSQILIIKTTIFSTYQRFH
jgi:hypothetical protein